MKIGILGSGQVAKALGAGFIKLGYEVMLGSRDVNKIEKWKDDTGAKVHIGNFEETVKFGELIVLSVLGRAAADVIAMAGPQYLIGKTIIDTTNPLSDSQPQDGVLKFFTNQDESLMEILQNRFPEAHFVKAFNSVGSAFMVNPKFKEAKPTMFICGNNDKSKLDVSSMLSKFGWEVADMGKATAARAIEPLCILWCIPGFLRNEWSHAFKLIHS